MRAIVIAKLPDLGSIVGVDLNGCSLRDLALARKPFCGTLQHIDPDLGQGHDTRICWLYLVNASRSK